MKRTTLLTALTAIMLMAACALFPCEYTAYADEGEPPPPIEQAEPSAAPAAAPCELFPVDAQTVIDGDTRQIIKTYILAENESPADIPRDGFERGGWRYTLTDVTRKQPGTMDTRSHVESVTVNTDTKDLDAILKQLPPTRDYQGEDGYSGVLSLDLATIVCEEAGQKSTSYTVTATREYPNLSSGDLSLIPKTITDGGRVLQLADVAWTATRPYDVDYTELPQSYTASAKYTANATKTTVTGYITTADYVGEVAKWTAGETVYTAYFSGEPINPTPPPVAAVDATNGTTDGADGTAGEAADGANADNAAQGNTYAGGAKGDRQSLHISKTLIVAIVAILLLCGAGAWFFFLRRNVKIFALTGGGRVLAAKARISARRPVVDLSPLDGGKFELVIDRFTAKALNGQAIEVVNSCARLKHTIAYEGNAYRVEADFISGTIHAVY